MLVINFEEETQRKRKENVRERTPVLHETESWVPGLGNRDSAAKLLVWFLVENEQIQVMVKIGSLRKDPTSCPRIFTPRKIYLGNEAKGNAITELIN